MASDCPSCAIVCFADAGAVGRKALSPLSCRRAHARSCREASTWSSSMPSLTLGVDASISFANFALCGRCCGCCPCLRSRLARATMQWISHAGIGLRHATPRVGFLARLERSRCLLQRLSVKVEEIALGMHASRVALLTDLVRFDPPLTERFPANRALGALPFGCAHRRRERRPRSGR